MKTTMKFTTIKSILVLLLAVTLCVALVGVSDAALADSAAAEVGATLISVADNAHTKEDRVVVTTSAALDGNNTLVLGMVNGTTPVSELKSLYVQPSAPFYTEEGTLWFDDPDEMPAVIGTKGEGNVYTFLTTDFGATSAPTAIQIVGLIGDVEFSAEISVVKYTVKFGADEAVEYESQDTIVAPIATPTKAPDATNHYAFSQWKGDDGSVYATGTKATKNIAYTAEFSSTAHNLSTVAYKAPTETTKGCLEHQECSGCDVVILGGVAVQPVEVEIAMLNHTHRYVPAFNWTGVAAGEKPVITYTCACESTYTVPAGDITLTKTGGVVATCTATGSETYQASATYEGVAASDSKTYTLEKLPHTLGEKVEAVAPVLGTAGNLEYWECSVCHTHFKDADANEAYSANGWVVGALYYETADVISISDLNRGGESAGNVIPLGEHRTYSYERTADRVSVVFKFKFQTSTWVSGSHLGSTQIRLFEGWNNDGALLLRDDNTYVYTKEGVSPSHVGTALAADTVYKIEFGRLAIMNADGTFTGDVFIYVKITDLAGTPLTADEYTFSYVYESYPSSLLENPRVFLTNADGNKFIDINYNGEAIKYMVDETEYASEIIYGASKLTKPAEDPSKEGHTFQYWMDSEGNDWNFDTQTADSATTLTAKFSKNKYSVTFGDQTTQYSYGDTIVAPETNPTKAFDVTNHYTFKQWKGDDDSVYATGALVTKTIVYTAEFNTIAHNLTSHEAVAATSTAAGNHAYDECGDCGALIMGGALVQRADVVIPQLGHTHNYTNPVFTWGAKGTKPTIILNCTCDVPYIVAEGNITLTKGTEVAATCEADGSVEYTASFDLNGTPTSDTKSYILPATGHTLGTRVDAVAPAVGTDGNLAYWECSVCHKHFKDEDGKVAYEDNEWVIGALYYETADEISVSDLCISGSSVGTSLQTSGMTSFSYDASGFTAQYGSLVFKAKYIVIDTEGTPQLRLHSGWGNNGALWLKDNETVMNYYENGVQYVRAAAIPTGEMLTLEFGRLAIMNADGTHTGTWLLYFKLNGTMTLSRVYDDLTADGDGHDTAWVLSNHQMSITSTAGNILYDMNYTGTTVTFKVDGEEYDQKIVFGPDFVTEPTAPTAPDGYTFDGWYTGAGIKWNFDTMRVAGDTVLIALFVSNTADIPDEEYFDDATFTPVIRFAVASDVHIGSSTSSRDTRLAKMFLLAYAYSANIGSYSALDLAMFVGDLGDSGQPGQWSTFKGIVEKAIQSGTSYIVSMGNHDFRGDSSAQTCIDNWKKVFGDDSVDCHVVINGFHFIALSPDLDEGCHFSGAKLAWLDAELAKATAATPGMPVFVMQHEAPKDTVYGSHDWNAVELNAIFEKYPQVVDFSGHSHYPLADPRSIWQGSYTALGTGTLHYYEMGLNGLQTTGVFVSDREGGYVVGNGAGTAAEFQIVEVDATGAIRVTVVDIDSSTTDDLTIVARYYIRNIADPVKLKYNHPLREEASAKPEFAAGAELSYALNESEVTITIPQAICLTDHVESYRAELYQGSKLVATKYALSDYFLVPMPNAVKVMFINLDGDTTYTVKVYAVNVWNKQCDTPLEVEFTTGYIAPYVDVPDEISIGDLIINGKPATTETINTYLRASFTPGEENKRGSFILSFKFLYLGADLQLNVNNNDHNAADMIWIREDDIWFMKDNYKTAPLTKGVHTLVLGREYVSSGEHAGEYKFWLKVDGELLHTTYTDRTLNTNGEISINFANGYAAGSRLYDISADIPTTITPDWADFANQDTVEISNWKELGGKVEFDSPQGSLNVWFEDANGAVTMARNINGTYVNGTPEGFYHYVIKTKEFAPVAGKTGKETIVKFCCDTEGCKIANFTSEKFEEETFAPYDVISISDLNILNNNGIYVSRSLDEAYEILDDSTNLSLVFKFAMLTGDLNELTDEILIMLGGRWNFGCALQVQPGNHSEVHFSWTWANPRGATKASFTFESNTLYIMEIGRIRVATGEWAGCDYAYLKINDQLILGRYADADDQPNTARVVHFRAARGKVTFIDYRLEREITFKMDDETYATVKGYQGFKVKEPVAPSKENLFFIGWYTAPEGGTRFDFNQVLTTTEDLTLYARFADSMFVITFVDEDGTTVLGTQEVGAGGQALKPANPTKTGVYKYEFVKWIDAETSEDFDFTKPVTKAYTLKAVYEEHKYVVAYFVNGYEIAKRYYTESEKVIIDGAPEVPAVNGAVGHWEYTAQLGNYDVLAFARYDGQSVDTDNTIVLDAFDGAKVDIANDTIRFYLSIVNPAEQEKWLQDWIKDGNYDKQGLVFKWTGSASSWTVMFADNEQFANAFVVDSREFPAMFDGNTLIGVGIFTPGKTYYWKVVSNDTGKASAADSFEVLDTPVRMISADTVYNMRDLGGWTTVDGKKVAYGNIYRGGQLKIDNEGEQSYMSKYSYMVFDYLGIKSEIELRGGFEHEQSQWNEYYSALYVPATGYESYLTLNEALKQYYRNVFELLADPSNYPVYFHCSWGADRTGSLAFLINGVLGVPYEQLAMDYELTSFSGAGKRERAAFMENSFAKMVDMIMAQYGTSGGTLKDAVERYLVQFVGVPQVHIDALRANMLIDAPTVVTTHEVTFKIDGEVYSVISVIDGKTASVYAPVYFDKYVDYWTLNGERFDLSTPVTADMVLEAVFASIKFDVYNDITLGNLGIEEPFTPDTLDATIATYTQYHQTGYRILTFKYSPIGLKLLPETGSMDGPHIELSSNVWAFKAHLWLQSYSNISVFVYGNDTANIINYAFKENQTYLVTVAILKPLNGPYAGKNMFYVIIDGELVALFETESDIEDGAISFAGTQGVIESIELNRTVSIWVNGEEIKTETVANGTALAKPTDPAAPAGKFFAGWVDDYGRTWNFENAIVANMKLTAVFEDFKVSVSVVDDKGNQLLSGIEVSVGMKVSELKAPVVSDESLEFVGWYNGDTLLSANDVITEDMVLEARFAPKQSGPVGPGPVDPGTDPTPVDPGDKGGLSTGAIIGIVVGSVVGAGAIGFCVWFFIIRKKVAAKKK